MGSLNKKKEEKTKGNRKPGNRGRGFRSPVAKEKGECARERVSPPPCFACIRRRHHRPRHKDDKATDSFSSSLTLLALCLALRIFRLSSSSFSLVMPFFKWQTHSRKVSPIADERRRKQKRDQGGMASDGPHACMKRVLCFFLLLLLLVRASKKKREMRCFLFSVPLPHFDFPSLFFFISFP